MDEKCLKSDELANYLDVSTDILARWRCEGAGPRFIKLGAGRSGQIRYRREDVTAWLEGRTFSNTIESRDAAELGAE